MAGSSRQSWQSASMANGVSPLANHKNYFMQLEELQFLLKKYNLTPNKLRGQNFLISDEVLQTILKASKVNEKDLVLEIGPGLGALTQELVKVSGQVISFEIDKNFQPLLNKLEKVNNNLQIQWQDILSLTDQQWQNILLESQNIHQRRTSLGLEKYKVIANIPYYLTGKLIPKFINAKFLPQSMTLMIQKEVAERIIQKNNKHSLLSLAVAFYGQSKIAAEVTRENFYPQPKVDSAIIYINKIKHWDYPVSEKKVWQLIHHGFASKRKKLLNNLSVNPEIDKKQLTKIFDTLSLDKNIRAEDLSIQNWLDLTKKIYPNLTT